MIELVEHLITLHKTVKAFFSISVELIQYDSDGETALRTEAFTFRGQKLEARPFLELEAEDGLSERIALVLGDMERNLDEFLYQGSGWVISAPLFLDCEVYVVRPLGGGGKCQLHRIDFLRKSGITINTSFGIDTQADDGRCLYQAVADHLLQKEYDYLSSKGVLITDQAQLVNLLENPSGGQKLPLNVSVKRTFHLEDAWRRHLNLSIAIHVVYCDEDKTMIPLHTSKNLGADVNVVVVLFHTEKGSHYALVEDPSKLFARRVLSHTEKEEESEAENQKCVRTTRKHICFKCFQSFDVENRLKRHSVFCREPNGQVVVMPKKGDTMEYDDGKELKRSVAFQSGYVLIFDFEALQIEAAKPCSCPPEVLENTRKEEAELQWFSSLSDDAKDDYLSELRMEEGLQDLYWAQDDYRGVPKSQRRTFKTKRKIRVCPHKQKVLKEQKAFSYSYVLMRRDGVVEETNSYYGDDAVEHFIDTVLNIAEKYLPKQSPGRKMEDMPEKDKRAIREATPYCYLCGVFMRVGDRSLDHDHLTGKFLGVAHSACNLMRREVPKITCMSHNLSGYDSHLIIPKLHKFGDRITSISAIPLNTQKFKTFSFNNNVIFLDSLAFLPDSLDKLVENLNASGCVFPLLDTINMGENGRMEKLPINLKTLLLRKGVYPYAFATSIEALENCTELPSKEEFFNDLTQEHISDSDYEHAQKVWKEFGIKNMMEYTTLYVKTDVLLLAEAVYDMRNNIWDEFGLDMCAYLSLPMLAKDIMLKYTQAEVELIHDEEMSNLLQNNIRGGLSFINKRVAVARVPNEDNNGADSNDNSDGDNNNNKKTNTDAESDKDSKVILYVDANNLYGRAMIFPLPYRGFRWMTDEELANFDLDKDVTRNSGDNGYILEVDLKYPAHLHLDHNSFPLAPHSMKISEADISPYSKQALKAVYGKTKHNSKKLVSTFKTRKHYVVHGLNLQLYKKLGLEVVKIRRGITFTQVDFIRPYIELCTQKRKTAPTESLKNIYKLLCNALYGKMIEGVFNRMDCKFNFDEKKATTNASSPLFMGGILCEEDFTISFLKKKKVIMNQSWAVGFSILELSKLVMQELYYETIQPAFGVDGCTVLMSDTDSFLLEVRAKSVDDAVSRIDSVMDFSNYPKDHPFYDTSRAKALGYLKNEVPNTLITHYVGLKSKTYMILTDDGGKQVRAKGVKKSHQNSIKFEQMMGCIEHMKGENVQSHFIRSKDHVIRLMKARQIAFSSFDDKRYLTCPIHSVPYGSALIGTSEGGICSESEDGLSSDEEEEEEEEKMEMDKKNVGAYCPFCDKDSPIYQRMC